MRQYFKNGICYPDDGFTKIPDDAVLIPENHWFLNLTEIPEGKKVITGKDGLPELVDIEKQPLETRVKKANDAIDVAAGIARKKLVSNGYAIEEEYWIAAEEAADYLEALKKKEDVPVPLSVQTHADVYGVSAKEAAAVICEKKKEWFNYMDKIRDIRLKGKDEIQKTADKNPDADLIMVAQKYLDQFEKANK